jgi:hypothetical protein
MVFQSEEHAVFKMTKLEFSETVTAICHRPAAYTLHGTLREVLAYLDGLGHAVGVQPSSHWGTSGFFEWLKKKLGQKDMRDDELLLTFGDEQAALSALARLYCEYAELEAAAEAKKS